MDFHNAVNGIDMVAFRKALSSASFYKTWQGRYDKQAWSLLTKYVGELV
ncbi:hypothetical protein [Burkholderia sp. Bp8998]|nr:hypothetical protein [Burkholderia sp. Bp8998]